MTGMIPVYLLFFRLTSRRGGETSIGGGKGHPSCRQKIITPTVVQVQMKNDDMAWHGMALLLLIYITYIYKH